VSERGGFRVAVTLDAEHPDRPLCPPDAVDRTLDSLASSGARATFFVQGRWAEAYPDRARRIADAGHLVGNHSHYHARMPLLHDDGIAEDVAEAAHHIRETMGVDPRPWFRCPFGEGHEDPRVLGALERLGYRDVHWSIVVEDWEPWRSAAEIEDDVVREATEEGDGAVVLLHTWPGPTADAMPGILRRLSHTGARFVGLDELEGAEGS
jgi:peptidoglycan-N-acetylglucosamine deacetylase